LESKMPRRGIVRVCSAKAQRRHAATTPSPTTKVRRRMSGPAEEASGQSARLQPYRIPVAVNSASQHQTLSCAPRPSLATEATLSEKSSSRGPVPGMARMDAGERSAWSLPRIQPAQTLQPGLRAGARNHRFFRITSLSAFSGQCTCRDLHCRSLHLRAAT
jgi:hypothetical protein